MESFTSMLPIEVAAKGINGMAANSGLERLNQEENVPLVVNMQNMAKPSEGSVDTSTAYSAEIQWPALLPEGEGSEEHGNCYGGDTCFREMIEIFVIQLTSVDLASSTTISNHSRIQLRGLFRLIGAAIGTHPVAVIVVGVLFILATLGGLYKIEIRDRVRDGYTPTTSRSRYEGDVLKEFFGSIGDPLMTTIILRAKDNGSMHRLEYLEEANEIHDFLRHNLTYEILNDDCEVVGKVGFANFCGDFCDSNLAIKYFTSALKGQLRWEANGKMHPSPSINLTYPITNIRDQALHLERNFFGVKVADKRQERALRNASALNNASPIRYVKAIMLTMRGEIMHEGDEERMKKWELRVYDYSKRQFNSSRIDMVVMGNEVVEHEMNIESKRTFPYFAGGFSLMFLFVACTMLFGCFIYGLLDRAKALLAIGAVLCPFISVASTFGLFALAGLRINSVMMIMPFIVCGIGVDDAFLVTHAWHRSARSHLPRSQRMGFVLEEAGPSITITTITNVLTFGIGATPLTTPTPEISTFCMATAVALALTYLYTLLLYMPAVCIATVVEEAQLAAKTGKEVSPFTSGLRLMLNDMADSSIEAYCDLLASRRFALLLFACQLTYWYFAIVGTLSLSAKLEPDTILPKNSPLREPTSFLESNVWTSYYPLTIIVNNPLDVRNKRELETFKHMVGVFEALPQCKGREFTVLWLRDYLKYVDETRMAGLDCAGDEEEVDTTAVKVGSDPESGYDYKCLKQFLSSPLYKHHSSFLKLNTAMNCKTTDASSPLPIDRFWFIVVYQNNTDWQERIELMLEWRRIADKYSVELNVTVWEMNAIYVDQMLSLKKLGLQNVLLTLVCMTVVCALFIQQPVPVVISIATIASISIGVIGFLSWWGLYLDPVTLCGILMTIGMSVDFTAHVAYHFQLNSRVTLEGGQITEVPMRRNGEKLNYTLRSLAWPMSQAGLSTIMCILPLSLLGDYIPLVFVKSVTLVATFGLYHGLLALPTLLFHMPASILEKRFRDLKMSKVQH